MSKKKSTKKTKEVDKTVSDAPELDTDRMSKLEADFQKFLDERAPILDDDSPAMKGLSTDDRFTVRNNNYAEYVMLRNIVDNGRCKVFSIIESMFKSYKNAQPSEGGGDVSDEDIGLMDKVSSDGEGSSDGSDSEEPPEPKKKNKKKVVNTDPSDDEMSDTEKTSNKKNKKKVIKKKNVAPKKELSDSEDESEELEQKPTKKTTKSKKKKSS